MKIIVLGSKGMLGQMVSAYFSSFSKYSVINYNEYFSQNNFSIWGSFIKSHPDAIIINCMGKIKQKSNDLSELTWSNSILPLALYSFIVETNYFIHASTDCVFTGKKGKAYLSSDIPDSNDAYGWSKRMGELALLNKSNVLIVRTSIIGLNNSPSASDLLNWFLKKSEGLSVKGYNNHLWNGITTLEWAKQIEKIIGKKHIDGIIHLGTEKHYSKYEMLLLFNKYFNKNITIQPYNHSDGIDRRLKPDLKCSSLESQIIELIAKNYSKYVF